MRQLQTGDIFTAGRIIKSLGIKDSVKSIMNNADNGDSGFELIYTILEAATESKVENELYAFVGSLLEYKPEEIKTMNIGTLFTKALEYVDFVGSGELKDFFQLVQKLTK